MRLDFSFPTRILLRNSIKDSNLPGRVQHPEFPGSHCWFDKGLKVPFRNVTRSGMFPLGKLL